MKYLQTSRTPGVFEMATQLKLKHSIELEPENEMYCQYCGRKLKREEEFSHNCRKTPL